MIPTYSSASTHRMGVIIQHLGQLNEYDFTKPHRHDYFEFFYFKKGGGNHIIDFKVFPITDNSVHIVAPGQIHQVNRELDSEGYIILFDLEMIEAPKAIENFLFEHICLDAEELKPTFKLSDNTELQNGIKLDELFKTIKENPSLGKLKIINALHGFCIDCMELKEVRNNQMDNDYLLFRKHLKNHFYTVKKVKEYAEMMHVSERSLNDLVKKHTGKSASEIITESIIMEAKRLLRTGISVKETAYTLNYDDPAHFSKLFKAKIGQSPSDFQNYT